MTQEELIKEINPCYPNNKLQAVKLILDFGKEKKFNNFGLKESKKFIDNNWKEWLGKDCINDLKKLGYLKDKKITVTLSEKAEKYLNKLMYSLMSHENKPATLSMCINWALEGHADFEEAMDQDVLTYLIDNPNN